MILNALPSTIYLALASYTFIRFRNEVLNLNRFLLFSWVIESIYRLVLAFIYANVDAAPPVAQSILFIT